MGGVADNDRSIFVMVRIGLLRNISLINSSRTTTLTCLDAYKRVTGISLEARCEATTANMIQGIPEVNFEPRNEFVCGVEFVEVLCGSEQRACKASILSIQFLQF